MNAIPGSPPTADSRARRPDRCVGFSLIELLAALSIITILALALAPELVRQHDRRAQETESTQLDRISKALQRHILRNRSVPNHNGFAEAVATELGCRNADVLLNARRNPRVFLLDPSVTNFVSLPYTQTMLGIPSAVPLASGIVVLSSLSEPLPPTIVSGFAASAAAFSNVWNNAENAIPAGWSWDGEPADLRITRLNLGTLFVPLALNYEPTVTGGTNLGRFTIDNSTTNILPTLPTFVSHYLAGTVVGLHHHAGTIDTLQARIVLQQPAAFHYQGSVWRGQSFLSRGMRPTGALDLQAAHDLFIASPINTEAQGSPPATPAIVINAMSAYMQEFILWRDAGYPNSHKSLDNAHNTLDTVTADLLHHASKSGP